MIIIGPPLKLTSNSNGSLPQFFGDAGERMVATGRTRPAIGRGRNRLLPVGRTVSPARSHNDGNNSSAVMMSNESIVE